MKLIVAFATDDEKMLIDNHFGDALSYMIYEITPGNFNHIETVKNTSEEEKVHADAKKASSISSILKKKGVNTLVARAFGGNIKRMREKFLCIKTDVITIEECLNQISKKLAEDSSTMNSGKGILILKN